MAGRQTGVCETGEIEGRGAMQVLLIDGHPGSARLTSHLLDVYASALPPGCTITRIAVRDLVFDPVLHDGYAKRQAWEPDVRRVAEALLAADHLVIAFPMWWGAEPAPLSGLLSRVLLPGFAFAYHPKDPWWDRLLTGRSADLIVTMDTPPIWLWFAFGNALLRRWRGQILQFVGLKPVRTFALGPVKQGGVEKNLGKWEARLAKAARSAAGLKRVEKAMPPLPGERT
ncbi:NAD(P)H-dependent oxidoreductase [Sandaracinobacter neustonicus]|nr:NAD(P)H-dependent oxidoreductase [Sandaracinobacter neustonicus]